jgi:hypothetical protein
MFIHRPPPSHIENHPFLIILVIPMLADIANFSGSLSRFCLGAQRERSELFEN